MYIKYLENMELYLKAQNELKRLIDKKQLLFDRTQPGATKYDSEKVSGGNTSNSKWDEYLDKAQELEDRIVVAQEIVNARKLIKDLSEQDLRNSKNNYDIIFVARVLERKKVYQITAIVNYSERQVNRYLKEINKNYEPYKKRWHKMSL